MLSVHNLSSPFCLVVKLRGKIFVCELNATD
jgi:hypothetical protein